MMRVGWGQVNEERKDEIGRLFLLSNEIDIEKLKYLELQEIIFLIFSAREFKEKQAFINDFHERVKTFFDILKDKIKNAEELYIAYDKNTNYPYIDEEDRIWIFSKKEYANKARDYFVQQFLMINMKKIDGGEIIQRFAKFHIFGIRKILIDNGEYNIEINRDDILPPPDWSTTPKINIPVTNPNLQYSMIKFFQQLHSKRNYKGKEQFLKGLEDEMLDEVIGSKYLIPMKLKEEGEEDSPNEEGIVILKKDTIMEFSNLEGDDDTVWQPAFTDWEEFEKVYDKDVWSGNIVTYDDLLKFSEKMDGIVINCRGVCLRINENNKKMIERYKKEKNNLRSASVTEETIKKDTEVIVGEPREYPARMIEAIREYMKKQKYIKKAYLRLMIKDNEKSYLIIVDFDDNNKKEIFQDIEEIAYQYLNGIFIDMSEMNDWARKVTKDVEPFYKRKLFGFFN